MLNIRIIALLFLTLSYLFLYGIGVVKHIRLDQPSFWIYSSALLFILSAPSRFKPIFSKLLAALVSITIILGLVDIALRAFLMKRFYHRPDEMLYARWPEMPKSLRFLPNRTNLCIGMMTPLGMNPEML